MPRRSFLPLAVASTAVGVPISAAPPAMPLIGMSRISRTLRTKA
jgi:hypothetical protein